MTIVYFIISLGVLVFIHEFGHFLAAKKQGIGVEKFSLGFGPRLLSLKRGETTYMISALPLGGYVKLHGEDPPEDPEAASAADEKSYAARPISQRSLVVFAGPFMNLLLAAVLMPLVFLLGRMEPAYFGERPVVIDVRRDSPAEQSGLKKGDEVLQIDDETPQTWKGLLDYVLLHADHETEIRFRRGGEVISRPVKIGKSEETHAGTIGIEPSYFIGNEPVIDEVGPGSPAAIGGLQKGDRVIRIGGSPIETWTDMSEKVGQSGGKKIDVTVRREGGVLTLALTPRYDAEMKKWLMGVQKDTSRMKDFFVERKYSLGEAVVEGTRENIKLAGLTLSVLKRLLTFHLSYKTLGGPIRIAQASAMAAKSGLSDFIYFLVFLSLQLGILNLLPFPVLDGGHLLFFGIEGVTRRPVSARVRGYAEQAGFFLLLSLMVLVTLNDVDSVWGFKQILDRIRHIF